MKKNGFVSTSIIYTFFIVFLLLMIFLLNSYSRVRYLLEEFKYDIKNSFAEMGLADINLYFMVWNNTTQEYELSDDMPYFGYEFERNFSYCKNGSTIDYINGGVSVSASGKDSCYAYFKEGEQDIILKIYTKETMDNELVLVDSIPNSTYSYTNGECSNGATLEFDNITRTFQITSENKTVCEVEFTRKEADVILNLYKEDALGIHEYNGLKYTKIVDIPGSTYIFNSYVCKNNRATITNIDGELIVESAGKDECDVYYNGGIEKVEIIIMQETEDGIAGYTTGKKYSRVYTIPSDSYAYVGYICEDSSATVKYENGTLIGESNSQTICRAYFNKYSDDVAINYYLQKSDNTYESVSNIPSLGYIYNKDKSSCQKNSEIKVENNIVYIEALDKNEVCDVYFDMVESDIKVLVYVMNRDTNKYELGDIPVAGYEMYNAGCTNGASIEYINSYLKVQNDGPTVCTLYFR